jgi:cold-inducible RNA-binding protein
VYSCPLSLFIAFRLSGPIRWPLSLDLESKHNGLLQDLMKETPMGKKLYVGNLSYEVDNASLSEMFTPHGTVESAQIITDRDTGRSKGFGFVEMGSENEAQQAIAAMNGQDNGGRALTVNEAKPKENRSGGFGGGSGGGSRGGYGGGGDRGNSGGSRGGYVGGTRGR